MESPKTFGKYEVISKVATGGFGVIYKGWDPFIKRPVAIKMCATPDEEVRKRFQQEAQFVGNLVHRNITLVFDFGVQDEIPYIVQEFLTGYDLDELVAAGAVGDTQTVVAILLQMCEGLDFAHHRGIVHRDIKPSNIRVLEDGTVKILDFGIAKSLEGGSKLTQTGIALGTAGYLAPEQIQGGTVDPRTDIFSVGVVAYELITGVRPFEGSSLSNTLYKILNEHPKPLPELMPSCSSELDAMIKRCMAKDPADRYQSVKELFEELRALSAADASGLESSNELTTGILRDAVLKMDQGSGIGHDPPTTDFSLDATEMTPAGTEISHSTETEPDEDRRRSPILTIFLVLLLLVVAGGATVYFSKDVQDVVFGPAGAPWIPTATATPTVTPTVTPTPTVTATPTTTPTPSPMPTVGPVSLRLVVDPPSRVTIDGKSFGSGRTKGGPVKLLPGTHRFTLEIADFPAKTFTREVSPDTKTISLSINVGLLTVMVDQSTAPPGGIAYLNGEALGPVPLIRRKVPAGDHELVVRWPNVSTPFRQSITVPRLPNELRLPPVAPPAN